MYRSGRPKPEIREFLSSWPGAVPPVLGDSSHPFLRALFFYSESPESSQALLELDVTKCRLRGGSSVCVSFRSAFSRVLPFDSALAHFSFEIRRKTKVVPEHGMVRCDHSHHKFDFYPLACCAVPPRDHPPVLGIGITIRNEADIYVGSRCDGLLGSLDAPKSSLLLCGCVLRHLDRRFTGNRPGGYGSPPCPLYGASKPCRCDHYAGRDLLRRPVWGVNHGHSAEYPRRIHCGRKLHRRLPDGPSGPGGGPPWVCRLSVHSWEERWVSSG